MMQSTLIPSVLFDPLVGLAGFPPSPLLTAGGAVTDAGGAFVHETIVIGGSSSTAISITGRIDDPEQNSS